MEKLMSMTDFVLEQNSDGLSHTRYSYSKCFRYANFLKQALTLGMFVPCDENGNVLEMPKCFGKFGGWNCACSDALMQLCTDKTTEYQKAKEKVLFKGFKVEKADNFFLVICDKTNISVFVSPDKTKNIEFLLKYDIEIELTESALKRFS